MSSNKPNFRFLDAFTRPDADPRPAKRIALADAALVLEISEFEILERAWRDHFGSRFTESQEKHFFKQIIIGDMEIPSWAATYAEKVLEEARVLRESRIVERQKRIQEIWEQSRKLPAIFYAGIFCLALYLLFLLSGNQISEYIPVFQSESEHIYTTEPEEKESKPELEPFNHRLPF